MDSSSHFFDKEARPYEQVSSASSRLQSAVDDQVISPSPWGTILSFLFGDVVGLMGVLSIVYGGVLVFEVAAVGAFYQTASVVLGGGILVYAVLGLYRRRFTHPALEMQRIGTVTLLAGLVAGGTLYVATGAMVEALLLGGGGAVGALVMPVGRALTRILFSKTSWWGFPAVIVSTGESGTSILSTLNRWPEIGLRPVALLGEGSEEADVPIRGKVELAPYLARTFDIPYVVLAVPGLRHEKRSTFLAQYGKFFDHVLVVPDPGGAPALWTTGRSGDGLFGYGVRNVALRPGARLAKRTVDLMGALCAVLLLAPLLVGIALLIRIDSSGAVFYRQERMGRGGRIITILKFRTMHTDAERKLDEILAQNPELKEEYTQYHKLQNDPRVTRIGKILRRYSLDELPQILNVLRGDMSLVGPRAYMPSELDEMEGFARAVLQTPPGVTGLWQVSGRNHLSFADRVNLDLHYIQNWSLWLDLYLLVRTGPVVLSGEGAS